MFQDFSQTVSMLSFVDVFNISIFVVFSACYLYQLIYVFIVLAKPAPVRVARANHRFAVLIAARNEREVIGDLLASIDAQNYPRELIDVYVIADNCTDDTAAIARSGGATVFTRFNNELVGKGYALDFGLKAIWNEFPDRNYEAFFVFDADNVLDANYFREMNATFDSGAHASTSYRNSKNFASNWISAGYGLWFLREAKFLNQARLTINSSCTISGTGFFIAADILKDAGGWPWHLMTEDIQFSAASIERGIRIEYCPTAILYDEQPITFKDSWNQRMRWAKGFYQVFAGYAGGLVKGIFTSKKGYKFACYDMLMTISPCALLSVISIFFNAIIAILGVTGVVTTGVALTSSISSIVFALLSFYLLMLVLGSITTFVEWDSIRASSARKVFNCFTFPLFQFTYVPIALVALFKKCSWKPIKHTISVDVKEFAEKPGERAQIV